MDWSSENLENQIAKWRRSFQDQQLESAPPAEELVTRLRDEIDALSESGLTLEEAFLVASHRVERLAGILVDEDGQGRKLPAREAKPGSADKIRSSATSKEASIFFALAIGAAAAVKIPELFGYHLAAGSEGFYARNASLFVLPFLIVYFFWKRRLDLRIRIGVVVSFVVAAFAVNVFPFRPASDTEALTAIHLPIALWLAVGIAYVEGKWTSFRSRMDFVRFSGEMFIHYVLIALGGAVFTGLTIFLFDVAGLDVETFVGEWLLPCGAAGAVLVAAGLVESGKTTNMAPVLTKLFTPLFTLVLIAFVLVTAWTGRGLNIERNILVGFDLLLVLVLCLILYAVSARGENARPGIADALQLALVVGAIVVDLVALGAISNRISEFGFSPNKTAALGLNLILLVNLVWTGWLYLGFLRGRKPFWDIEIWQTSYLAVLAVWAAVVAFVFPPIFGFS